MKRFFLVLLIATICFLAGVAVGRFVMPREMVIVTIDIKEVVEIIERYNEAKNEFKKIKEWNEEAIVGPKPKEQRETH